MSAFPAWEQPICLSVLWAPRPSLPALLWTAPWACSGDTCAHNNNNVDTEASTNTRRRSRLPDSRIVELCRGSELVVFSPSLVTMSKKFTRQESNGRKEAAFNYSPPIWSSWVEITLNFSVTFPAYLRQSCRGPISSLLIAHLAGSLLFASGRAGCGDRSIDPLEIPFGTAPHSKGSPTVISRALWQIWIPFIALLGSSRGKYSRRVIELNGWRCGKKQSKLNKFFILGSAKLHCQRRHRHCQIPAPASCVLCF